MNTMYANLPGLYGNKIVDGKQWAEITNIRRGMWVVTIHKPYGVFTNDPPHPSNRLAAYKLALEMLKLSFD